MLDHQWYTYSTDCSLSSMPPFNYFLGRGTQITSLHCWPC